MYKDRYLTTFKRVFLLVLAYSFCRVLFFVFNYETFAEATAIETLLSFVYGIRFDLSIICASNLLFIVMSFLPLSIIDSKIAQGLLKIIFLLVNIPLLFMNLADIEYFKFTLKRTGYDVVGILGDVQHQSLQLVIHYWYVLLLMAILIFLLSKFYKAAEGKEHRQAISRWAAWSLFPIILFFSILAIRGGLQYKPLKPDHAFIQTPNVLGNLVLNTPYNFFTTMNFPRVENIFYYTSDLEARKIIQRNASKLDVSAKGSNVVIIILESFSREYMGIGDTVVGYTPFLDSLAKQGAFFDRHFANGRRSIEAVPSIFASIPSLMEEPYITGVYQSNELHGLAESLSKEGYFTAFFHGGRNGTMGFDKFAMNAGFHNYYGLDEYPKVDEDFDGNWGIYDEPYLQYFSKTVSTFKKPFLASVFTLSSHQPYSVPIKYKGVFPKGNLEIHESIGYADRALKNFFESAAKEDWYTNTLFIITADHTQGLATKKYQNTMGEYRVPLILFHPGRKVIADTSQVTHHADIMPTVLDYVDVENQKKLLFGRSLFDSSEGRSLFYSNKNFTYVKHDYYIEFDTEQSRLYGYHDWEKTTEIKDQPLLKDKYEKEIKAYIQYYNNGLNNNSWYR